MWWQMLGDFGFLFFALGLLILGTSFLVFTGWWRSTTGRGMAAFFISANAIITLSFLRLFHLLEPTDAWFVPLRAIVFFGGGLAVLTVGVMFVRLQFHRRKTGDRQRQEVRID
jgi:acyl-CoA synthetase (AMP-forming)/AMP-acid ligase II